MPGLRSSSLLGAFSLAVALAATAACAGTVDSTSWLFSTGSHFVQSRPMGGFHPPSSAAGIGFAVTAAFIPPRRPVGLRLEFGGGQRSSSLRNIPVSDPAGGQFGGVDSVLVQTGSRVVWGMIGAQWELRSHDSGLYLFGMIGAERISPVEKLGNGFPVIQGDVPGLPAASAGFAWSTGIGTRLRVPGTKSFSLTGEFDFRRLGAAAYVGPPGVAGDFPSNHFVVAHGPVQELTFKIGILRTSHGE